jgi:hypothetical protein
MGLQHMVECTPKDDFDDAIMAGIEVDAMVDDADTQAQFYE